MDEPTAANPSAAAPPALPNAIIVFCIHVSLLDSGRRRPLF
jgi:hypothetical protein